MTDNLDSAANSLAEQTKKIDFALFYTHGDMDKAKEMVAGSYKDVFAIKANISTSSIYGAFLLFFNHNFCASPHVLAIISTSFKVGDLKTTVPWRQYEMEIADLVKEGDHDAVLGKQLQEGLTSYFSIQFDEEHAANELQSLLQRGDDIGVGHLFQRFIESKIGFQNVSVSVDSDEISSIDMEFLSKTSEKVNPRDLPSQKAKDEEKKKMKKIEKMEGEGEEEEDPLDSKTVKLILMGSLILSPIRGKDISKIIAGDKVKIKIVDENPKAISVAKAFDAYDDGEIGPIGGRVISIKMRGDGGYSIVVIIAKGIFVKIEEDEGNIKVLMDTASSVKPEKETASTVSVPFLILLVVIFVILIAMIIFFLKS
ncbi:MAG: hypothetical protein GY754_21060 [bacterium]|nr:hypothetical protein [bacterium]